MWIVGRSLGVTQALLFLPVSAVGGCSGHLFVKQQTRSEGGRHNSARGSLVAPPTRFLKAESTAVPFSNVCGAALTLRQGNSAERWTYVRPPKRDKTVGSLAALYAEE